MTITKYIEKSNNDASENDAGTFSTTGTNILLGNDGSNECDGGFRFMDVQIPVGATIDSAYIFLYSEQAGDPTLKIYADDADNSVAFDAINNISARTLTTANVDWDATWTAVEGYKQSPDIQTVIQEVVDRADWSPGNALSILVLDDSSPSSENASVVTYEENQNQTAKLEITFTASDTLSVNEQSQKQDSIGRTVSKKSTTIRNVIDSDLARSARVTLATNPGDGRYTDLQTAINALNDVGGGTIYVLSGTYTIDSVITMYSNISIIGEDNNNVVFDVSGLGAGEYIGSSDVVSNIAISNIKITGYTLDEYLIYFKQITDLTISNNRFISNGSGSGFDIYIDYNSSSDFSSDQILVENNYFYEAGRIDFSIANSGRIVGNTFINNNRGSIAVTVGDGAINVSDNTIIDFARNESAAYGIVTAVQNSGGQIIITSNNIKMSTVPTTGFDSGAILTSGSVIVSNNSISAGDFLERGVYIIGDNSIVSGNLIVDCDTGIDIYGDRFAITGNSISGNDTVSIILESGSDNGLVVGNVAKSGITDNGTGNTVANNET